MLNSGLRLSQAQAAVLNRPSDARLYLEVSRLAHISGRRYMSDTAYALTLVCAGTPRRETQHLFEDRQFLLNSRYYLFYFHTEAPPRARAADLHIFERRFVREMDVSLHRRRAALKAITFVPPIDLNKPPILVCGMPKSASTFISHCLGGALGYRVRGAHNMNDGTGTGFDLTSLLRVSGPDIVAHSHLSANARVLTYIKIMGIRPIITVRNIFDALRSYADHLSGSPDLPGRDTADLQSAAVLRMAFHYVDFFATWSRASSRGVPACFIDYQTIRTDPEDATSQAIVGAGRNISGETVAGAVARALDPQHRPATRFNIGRSGRGKEIPDDLRRLVRSLYMLHPDIDFGRIDDA